MRAATLRALLWKDLRHNRMVLIAGVLICALPYLLSFANGLSDNTDIFNRAVFASLVGDAAVNSFPLSIVVVGLLAACVTAEEYTDRSAVFLAYLPPSNAAVLLSKTICIVVPCVLMSGVSFVLMHIGGGPPPYIDDSGSFLTMIIAIWVLFFGATWLVGLVTRSPAGAIMVGLVLPAILLITAFAIGAYFSSYEIRENLFHILALSVGIICFALGWVYGLRRGRATA